MKLQMFVYDELAATLETGKEQLRRVATINFSGCGVCVLPVVVTTKREISARVPIRSELHDPWNYEPWPLWTWKFDFDQDPKHRPSA